MKLNARIGRIKILAKEINNMSHDDDQLFEEEDTGTPEKADIIENPFDPKKVDVSITTPNLGTLITRLEHNEINLFPDFQRSPDLWSPQTQSRLIESILIRLPIPAFYFDVLEDDHWQVVDGLQRLSTIKNFVINKNLSLTRLEFLTDYEGFHYNDLPRSLKRRIDEFQTSVYLIKPGTPVEMKYSLFNRINTGGLKLKPQEIRHALSQGVNHGRASKFLKDISEHTSFTQVVTGKNARMTHQELVLRHMAFRLFGSNTYKSSLPKFLDNAMIDLGELGDKKIMSFRDDFLASMETAYSIFKDHAFRRTLTSPPNYTSENKSDRTLAQPSKIKMINKPLFESLSVCLALISADDRSQLIQNSDAFKEAFKEMLSNQDFHISITKSTANTTNVQTRFHMIKELIGKFIGRCV